MSNISEIQEQEEEMSLNREEESREIKNISKLNDKNWNRMSYFKKIKYLEKIEKEQKKSEKKNKQRIDKYEKSKFYNISLLEVFEKISATLKDIVIDLTSLENYKLSEIVDIFTKNDRLIYAGILLILLSMVLHIIFISQ